MRGMKYWELIAYGRAFVALGRLVATIIVIDILGNFVLYFL
jgi:hypothetical protein